MKMGREFKTANAAPNDVGGGGVLTPSLTTGFAVGRGDKSRNYWHKSRNRDLSLQETKQSGIFESNNKFLAP